MAFNPIHHFRKYRRFWMAAILLLSMTTFVLCTGQGGDLAEWFKGRGPRGGATLAKLDGSSLDRAELEMLKRKRNAANDFMRKSCEIIIEAQMAKRKQLDAKKGDPKTMQKELIEIQQIQMEFTRRKQKPRYFEGSINLEGLVEYKLWLLEADRLNITLPNEAVAQLIFRELEGQLTKFTDRDSREVLNMVRQGLGVSDAFIFQALRDEFRVRLARIARVASLITASEELNQYRTPFSPNQLWQYYQKERSTFDVDLVPIPLTELAKDIAAPSEQDLKAFFQRNQNQPYNPESPVVGFKMPESIQVEWIVADPESPPYKAAASFLTSVETFPVFDFAPSIGVPMNAIRWAMAGPVQRHAYFNRYEELLERAGQFLPETEFAAALLTEADFLTRLIDYKILKTEKELSLAVASYLGAAARPDASLAAPLAMRSVVYSRHKKEFQDLAKAQAKKRFPLYATAISLSPHAPFVAGAVWFSSGRNPQSIPLDLVEPAFHKQAEKQLAIKLANHNMIELRKFLDNPRIKGNRPALERALTEMSKKFAFQKHTTKDYYNQYDIAEAKELKPLRDSFEKWRWHVNMIESRVGTDRNLNDGDFPRLFFEKGEALAVADASYVPRAWPPILTFKPNPQQTMIKPENYRDVPRDVMQRYGQVIMESFHNMQKPETFELFNEAEMPILFWRVESKPPHVPAFEKIRDKVLQAWKMEKARDKVLPLAEEIAKKLQAPDLTPELADNIAQVEAAKLKQRPILISNMAPLVPEFIGDDGSKTYRPYQLPKGTISQPRKDTVENLLSMENPKAAIDIKYSDGKGKQDIPYQALNNLNKKLFDTYTKSMVAKKGADKGAPKTANRRYVQVMTNGPQSEYYVAVIVRDPAANILDFEFAYIRSIGRARDAFVQLGYEHFSKTLHEVVLTQLKNEYGYEILADAEQRKGFDTD